jgi:hypothetical protein
MDQHLKVKAVCKHETEAALLVITKYGEDWIPKSQVILDESEVLGRDDEGVLVISLWLADRLGWHY